MMEDDNSRKEKNLDTLYKWRDFLDRVRVKLSNSFDRYLLTIATGGLYLSVYFTSGQSGVFLHVAALAWGWGLLLLSIFVTLLSIIFSVMAYQREISIADMNIEAQKESQTVVGANNEWNFWVDACRWVSMATFMAGIASLAYFYFVNLTLHT